LSKTERRGSRMEPVYIAGVPGGWVANSNFLANYGHMTKALLNENSSNCEP
jgi:hypothetical protein